MQFADFVVSAALQALTRGLKKVGQTSTAGSALAASDEKGLLLIAGRLLSLWQMAQWSVSKLQFERAQADLREVIMLCNGEATPEIAAAERLLERADPKSARILGDIIYLLPGARADSAFERRDRLDSLLQAESTRWRDYTLLRQIDEQELIEHGMLRAFDKAHGLSSKLDRVSASSGGERRVSAKRLLRAGRWTRHSVNHLELLRPALSESARTRRWHLNRLAAKLDEQWALERLARSDVVLDVTGVDSKKKASVRLLGLMDDQRQRLEKQRRKLSVGAFAGGQTTYRLEVSEAVAQLGLDAITLLPLDSVGRQTR